MQKITMCVLGFAVFLSSCGADFTLQNQRDGIFSSNSARKTQDESAAAMSGVFSGLVIPLNVDSNTVQSWLNEHSSSNVKLSVNAEGEPVFLFLGTQQDVSVVGKTGSTRTPSLLKSYNETIVVVTDVHLKTSKGSNGPYMFFTKLYLDKRVIARAGTRLNNSPKFYAKIESTPNSYTITDSSNNVLAKASFDISRQANNVSSLSKLTTAALSQPKLEIDQNGNIHTFKFSFLNPKAQIQTLKTATAVINSGFVNDLRTVNLSFKADDSESSDELPFYLSTPWEKRPL